MLPYPECQRTTAKMTRLVAPEIQRIVFPETRVVPAPTRTRCRPKTHPSTMMDNHGKSGYLMLRESVA